MKNTNVIDTFDLRWKAAIKLPDGKVFVGSFHGKALEKAANAGYSEQVLEKAELGFSHSSGAGFERAEDQRW